MIERAFGILMIEKKISVNTNDMSYVLYKKKKKYKPSTRIFFRPMHQGLVGTYPFLKKIIRQKDQIIFVYNILETQIKNRSLIQT